MVFQILGMMVINGLGHGKRAKLSLFRLVIPQQFRLFLADLGDIVRLFTLVKIQILAAVLLSIF